MADKFITLGNLAEYSSNTDEKIREFVNDKVSEVVHPEYTLVKKESADDGYISSYNLTKNGEVVGSTINIPKDYLVKSATLETVTIEDTPIEGYIIGDKYIDFVVNTVQGDENTHHIYLLVSDLVDTYKSGQGIVISDDNVVSIVMQDGTKTVGGITSADYIDFKGAVTKSNDNETAIDSINAEIEQNKTDILNVKTDIQKLQNQDNILSSRIDTLSTLPDGSTTADAELADIRVSADGTTYENAGTAVRTQVGELKNDLVNLGEVAKYNNGEWVDGYYIRITDGGAGTRNGYSITNHISILPNTSKIIIKSDIIPNEPNVGVAFYNNKVFISGVHIEATTPHSFTLTEVDVPANATTFRYTTLTTKKDETYASVLSSYIKPIEDLYLKHDSVIDRFNYLLTDTIDKPMIFTEKNIIGFGDSIMKGYKDGGVLVEKNWVDLFLERSGATNFTNRAIGGAGFGISSNSIASQLTGQILNTRDYIFIGAGTNDYHYSISKTAFQNGVNSAFDIIDTNKGTQTKVIVITPINRTQGTPNNNPIPLDWYRETITMMSLQRGYSVIDGSKMGFTSVAGNYQEATMVDGLHPNELGYEIYARHLYGLLL